LEDDIFEDCRGCKWRSKLAMQWGTYTWCNRGVIRYSKRKCPEKEIEVTLDELDRIDRRLKRKEEDKGMDPCNLFLLIILVVAICALGAEY